MIWMVLLPALLGFANIAAAVANPDFWFNNRPAVGIVALLGRGPARVVYALLGVVCFGGSWMGLNIIHRSEAIEARTTSVEESPPTRQANPPEESAPRPLNLTGQRFIPLGLRVRRDSYGNRSIAKTFMQTATDGSLCIVEHAGVSRVHILLADGVLQSHELRSITPGKSACLPGGGFVSYDGSVSYDKVGSSKSGRLILPDGSMVSLPWPGTRSSDSFVSHDFRPQVHAVSALPSGGWSLVGTDRAGSLTARGGRFVAEMSATGELLRSIEDPWSQAEEVVMANVYGDGQTIPVHSKPRFKGNATEADKQVVNTYVERQPPVGPHAEWSLARGWPVQAVRPEAMFDVDLAGSKRSVFQLPPKARATHRHLRHDADRLYVFDSRNTSSDLPHTLTSYATGATHTVALPLDSGNGDTFFAGEGQVRLVAKEKGEDPKAASRAVLVSWVPGEEPAFEPIAEGDFRWAMLPNNRMVGVGVGHADKPSPEGLSVSPGELYLYFPDQD